MFDFQGKLWSDNPDAPKISRNLYLYEKTDVAGIFIATILYGIIITVFFRCMAALFNPVYRKGERIKWWLVSYTVVMFSAATVFTWVNIDLLSIAYIDNREFPDEGKLPPGPYGYQLFISSGALNVATNAMFLSSWLAEGLLLYRCYVICSRNLWIITFPCLVYLSTLVMGVMFVYQDARSPVTTNYWSAIPYISISISLDLLLTFMIAVRLVVYVRNTRTAMGIAGIGGLCKAIVTMLVESSVIYAVTSLLFLVPWTAGNPTANIFLPILGHAQILSPLLIVQRVTNKSALTSNTLISGHLSSFKARSGGKSTGDGDISGVDAMSSADKDGMNSSELSGVTVS